MLWKKLISSKLSIIVYLVLILNIERIFFEVLPLQYKLLSSQENQNAKLTQMKSKQNIILNTHFEEVENQC